MNFTWTALTMDLIIRSHNPSFRGEVELPYSKSISNRALMIQAYAQKDEIEIDRLSDADDTRLLQKNLEQIFAHNHPHNALTIDCGNAGTVFRFLTTLLASRPGLWLLSGSPRMKERPVANLVESLRHLGADIKYAQTNGFPPLKISGKTLEGGKTSVSMDKSSQFASSLVMAAPNWKNGLELKLEGRMTSLPYLKMSLELMRQAGATIKEDENCIFISPKPYHKTMLKAEADWSSAAFWFELVALSKGGSLLLKGLSTESLQGDSEMVSMFAQLGVKTNTHNGGLHLSQITRKASALHFDLKHQPDMLPALAVCCAGLGCDAQFSGLANLAHKESDRTAALQAELAKFGVDFLKHDNDTFFLNASKIKKAEPLKNLSLATYNDHRLAMAFAPLALVFTHIEIEKADVVSKSYPRFWEALAATEAVKLLSMPENK